MKVTISLFRLDKFLFEEDDISYGNKDAANENKHHSVNNIKDLQ